MLIRFMLVWRVEDKEGAPLVNLRELLPAGAPMPPRPALGEIVRFIADGRSFRAEVTLSELEYVVDSLNNIECSMRMLAKEI